MRKLEIQNPSGPLDEATVTAFESLIGARLPDAYREFIKTTNGGSLSVRNNRYLLTDQSDRPDFLSDREYLRIDCFFNLQSNVPHRLVLATAFTYHKDLLPPGTIPIADDCFGNEFLLGIPEPIRGLVYFFDRDFSGINSSSTGNPFENVLKLADSFEEFVDALVEAKD